MIELVLVYCLAADAKACVERRDPMAEYADPLACMEQAQMQAQHYLSEHPRYVLSRFRCEVDLPRQRSL
jgi:hypothetical protein